MKNLTKTITALTAAAVLGATSAISASARDTDYTREELVDLFWTDYWSDSLPGEENPEGSLEYYILECFLDENYGVVDRHVVLDWSSYYLISSAWEDYHDEFTLYWDYEDDDETNEFTIRSYDPETDEYGDTLYTFELIDGMWNMIDVNGNTVLTFEPHGGDGSWAALKEQESESESSSNTVTNRYEGMEVWETIDGITKHYYDGELIEEYQAEDGVGNNTISKRISNSDESVVTTESSEEASNSASSSNSNRVTGTTVVENTVEETTSEADSSETDEEEENTSLPIPLIIAGVVVVGGGAGAIIYSKKKKNGGKKK
ncbi:MAG: hypothetical protein LUE12_00225 [Ruminococcus sp.]|nr:hypothetical protein [Ruminococcus sp.]